MLVAPAVDITEAWWEAMDEGTRSLGYRTGFVHVISDYNPEGLALRMGFFDEAHDHFLLDRHAKDIQVISAWHQSLQSSHMLCSWPSTIDSEPSRHHTVIDRP